MKSTDKTNPGIDIAQALGNFLQQIEKYSNKYGFEPLPGSQEAHEFGIYTENIQTAYSLGDTCHIGAGDQLYAFQRSIIEPSLSFAPWTCIRAVLESSAIACWLFDPLIDMHERIGRGFAYRIEGLIEQEKFARAQKEIPNDGSAETKRDEIIDKAIKLGYEPNINEKGKKIGIKNPKFKKATEFIRDYLDEEANYRLFSAVIHNHTWATQILGLRPVGFIQAFNKTSSSKIDLHVMQSFITPKSILFLCSIGVKAFISPTRMKCKLFGWDSSELELIISQFSSLMKINFPKNPY